MVLSVNKYPVEVTQHLNSTNITVSCMIKTIRRVQILKVARKMSVTLSIAYVLNEYCRVRPV